MLNPNWRNVYEPIDFDMWVSLSAGAPPIVYSSQEQKLWYLLKKYYRTSGGNSLNPRNETISFNAYFSMLKRVMEELAETIAEEENQLMRASKWNRGLIKTASDGKFSYSCLMIDMPKKLAAEIVKWGEENITDDMLYDPPGADRSFGREDHMHATVLYGIDKNISVSMIKKEIKSIHSGPVSITLGPISKFDTDPDFDVIKISVVSEDLNKLHNEIEKSIGAPGNKFPNYIPHVTIAYVAKGSCDKLLGLKPFAGKSFKLDTYDFSDPSASHKKIKADYASIIKFASIENDIEEKTDEDVNALMNRIEDKYFVDQKYLSKISSELSDRFVFGDIDTDTRFTRNKTIYLDSDDLEFLTDCVDKKLPRTKIRIRQYSPDDEGWEKVAYAEFKIKDDELTKKIRIRIPDTDIDKMSDGNSLIFSEELVNINRDITRDLLKARVKAINKIIKNKGLRKRIEVQYERKAYSGKNIRITIDNDLSYSDATKITMATKKTIESRDGWGDFVEPYINAASNSPMILEVKTDKSTYPNWLKKLLKSIDAIPTPFSKYAASMITHLKTDNAKGKVFVKVISNETITASISPIKKNFDYGIEWQSRIENYKRSKEKENKNDQSDRTKKDLFKEN